MHLVGSLDGRVFEDRELTFSLGEGGEHSVPTGVEEALEKFKTGERSRLTLAPAYAFGAEGSVPFEIPANATVQYEVKLKSFEKVSRENGFYWRGSSVICANAQAKLFGFGDIIDTTTYGVLERTSSRLVPSVYRFQCSYESAAPRICMIMDLFRCLFRLLPEQSNALPSDKFSSLLLGCRV